MKTSNSRNLKHKSLPHWLLILVAITSVNSAQSQDASPTAPNAERDPVLEEVLVTGSRIARRDFSAESPIVSVEQEVFTLSPGVSVEDTLKLLPQFNGAPGATAGGNVPAAPNQQANLQLRGLGRQRTLVLMDGQRLPPSNPDSSISVNMVPMSLVERAEVVTGGASAAYGSDAVAGVVNFIMKKEFEGVELRGQYGQASEGDAELYYLTATAGTSFANKQGNAYLSYTHTDRNRSRLIDRAWSDGSQRRNTLPGGSTPFNPNNLPSPEAYDVVFGSYGIDPSLIARPVNVGYNFDGTLFTNSNGVFNFSPEGSAFPDQFYVTAGRMLADRRYFMDLQRELKSDDLFGRVSYNFNDSVEAHAQILVSLVEQINVLAPTTVQTSQAMVVPVTNPFIPGDLATLLASRANPNQAISIEKRTDEFGPRPEINTYDTYQLRFGLAGDLDFRDWSWDVTASAGQGNIDYELNGVFSRSAVSQLLNAPDGGASICQNGYNPFGERPVSESCLSYLLREPINRFETGLYTIDAILRGGLFDLPAGTVQFAAGANYRRDTFDAQIDELIRSGDINSFSGLSYDAESEVSELFAETLIPILANIPAVEELALSLGYRYSDYDTIGGVSTYKAGLEWQIVPSVRLRGGYDRAIRAPNLSELFTPVTSGATVSIGRAGTTGQGDPCDVTGAYRTGSNGAAVRQLCLEQGVPGVIIDSFTYPQSNVIVAAGGNLDLSEETADTYSIGAVFNSSWEAPEWGTLVFAVDYFEIEIEDAIGSITAPIALQNCFNLNGQSNPAFSQSNAFCQRISRTFTGQIDEVGTSLLNLGGYEVAGVDMQIDWLWDLNSISAGGLKGQLRFNVNTSYLEDFKIKTLPADDFVNFAGTIGNGQVDGTLGNRPQWRSVSSLQYKLDSWGLTARWRYYGSAENSANAASGGNAPGVPEVNYYDLHASYGFQENTEIYLSVTNLTDKQPPIFPSAGETDTFTYDVLGRRWSIGIRYAF